MGGRGGGGWRARHLGSERCTGKAALRVSSRGGCETKALMIGLMVVADAPAFVWPVQPVQARGRAELSLPVPPPRHRTPASRPDPVNYACNEPALRPFCYLPKLSRHLKHFLPSRRARAKHAAYPVGHLPGHVPADVELGQAGVAPDRERGEGEVGVVHVCRWAARKEEGQYGEVGSGQIRALTWRRAGLPRDAPVHRVLAAVQPHPVQLRLEQ